MSERFEGELQVAGCRLAVAQAGIRYRNRSDLCLIELAENSSVAAVFTRNRFCAAPVLVAREHLAHKAIRYLLINSGNANAGTGDQGMQRARETCQLVAAAAGVKAEQVLPFSTGVIGEPLPVDPFVRAVPDLVARLSPTAWPEAARAIMTTDTRPKLASRQLVLEGHTVNLVGIAKGAGMIHPNMATMLGYIVCDAPVAQPLVDSWNAELADLSFNCVTVDGDTSTNDSCVLACTGAISVDLVASESDPRAVVLKEQLRSLYLELAHALVRDGEGATKFVTIRVGGGQSYEECRRVAFSVAHSPLVKTALYASDPNWGRILAAIGNAGIEDLDTQSVSINLDETALVRAGQRAADYTEEQGQAVFSKAEFCIDIDLGRGPEEATVWTSDLSHEYVTINAEYRS